MTNTATGGQQLGENVRISLMSFNSEIEVLHSFFSYDRSTGSGEIQRRLAEEIEGLGCSNQESDFDTVFDQMNTEFERSFRSDACRHLVLYTDGNQDRDPDYDRIRDSLDNLDMTIFGLSFSAPCSGLPSDTVCPNSEFFQEIATSGDFETPRKSLI